MGTGTSVFWSYSHEDDKFDNERITRLAKDLRAELSMLATDPPRIFLDRDGLEWGEEWRRVLGTALAEAPLLIAIVTPRYFVRPECRRELLTFHSASCGVGEEYVLPILYIAVDGLTEDNPDEAYALVARTQFFDFRVLRLAAVDSVEYRTAVNALSKRVLALITTITERQLAVEYQASETSTGDLDLLLAKAEELWPEWLSAVQSDDITQTQVEAINRAYNLRRERLRIARARPNTIMDAYRSQGADVLPLMEKHVEAARVYSAKTIELDPIVRACVRAGRENAAFVGLLPELLGRIDEAVIIIEREGRINESGSVITVKEFTNEMPYVPQTWKRILALVDQSAALITEANEAVMAWAASVGDLVGVGDADDDRTVTGAR